jgi:predicted flap endonuclease-1-like 5' DNA nuclease
MAFSTSERALLLGVKGVGPTVIQRLEEVGIHDLATLAAWEPAALCAEISQRLGATCWRNSPLANRAIADAITSARSPFAC